MNAIPQSCLVVQPDGIYRVTSKFENLGDMDTYIRGFAADIPVALHNVANVGGLNVHISSAQKYNTVYCRLPSIRIDSSFVFVAGKKKDQKSIYVPVWSPREDTQQMVFNWSPPPECSVWFISYFEVTEPNGKDTVKQNLWKNSYLVAISTNPNVKGAFKLPLPNIYPDCRICVGENRMQPNGTNEPLLKSFTTCLENFNKSPWVAHLLEGVRAECIAEMFTFDSDTKQNIAPSVDWVTCCSGASTAVYNNLPFKALIAGR